MKRRNGFASIVVLVFGFVLAILSALLVKVIALEFNYISHSARRSASLELAKAGLEKAVYEYLRDPEYKGEDAFSFGRGTIKIKLHPSTADEGVFRVRVEGTSLAGARTHTTSLEATYALAIDGAGRATANPTGIRMVGTRGAHQ